MCTRHTGTPRRRAVDTRGRPVAGTLVAATRRAFLTGTGVAAASLLAGCTVARTDAEAPPPTSTPAPAVELAPIASPELAPIDQEFEVITAAPATATPTPTRYRIYDVTIVVDEASDGSGPFADGELELSGVVKIRAYDARTARWLPIQGVDRANIVGRLAARGATLDMRAGERRRLNVDTVVEFPAGPPLDHRSYISVGATIFEEDVGNTFTDTFGYYEGGHEYRWRSARGGPGGEVLYTDGDSRLQLLFRVEPVV